MISFDNKVFNLRPIRDNSAAKAVEPLLIPGESIVAGFATVRDKMVFTTHRIIAVDIQGVGKKVGYCSLPYTRIANFCIETADVIDLDCTLEITTISGAKSTFEFTGGYDIRGLYRTLAARIL